MLTPERKAQMDAVLGKSTLSPERRAQMDAVLGNKPQSGIGGFVKGMIQPLIDAGRFVGGSIQTVPAALKAIGKGGTREALDEFNQTLNNSLFSDKQKQTLVKDKTGGASSLMGAKLGAGVAPYILPVGGTLPQALVSGATGGALSGFSQGEGVDVGRIGAGASFGALSGVGGNLISKGLGRLGGSAESAGRGYALRGIRATPSQQKAFKDATGQALEDFIARNKLYGSGTEAVDKVIKPLQEAFDELTINSGQSVNSKVVLDKFDEAINALSTAENSLDPANRTLAEFLKGERDNFAGSVGSEVGVDFLTKARRSIDQNTPNKQFDLGGYGKQRALGNVYRNVISDTAGTKDMGRNLSNLYRYREIVDKQSGVGRGTQPLNIFKLGSAMAGGQMAGVPGAIAGYAAERVINNPRTTFAVSRGIQKSGQVLQKQVPKLTKPVVGAVTSGLTNPVEDRPRPTTFIKPKTSLKKSTQIKLPTYKALRW